MHSSVPLPPHGSSKTASLNSSSAVPEAPHQQIIFSSSSLSSSTGKRFISSAMFTSLSDACESLETLKSLFREIHALRFPLSSRRNSPPPSRHQKLSSRPTPVPFRTRRARVPLAAGKEALRRSANRRRDARGGRRSSPPVSDTPSHAASCRWGSLRAGKR